MLRRLATLLVLLPALLVPPASAATSLGTFQVTYYWFAAESGFVGQKITAPGLPATLKLREDFLYSARGVAMEGTGTAQDGRHVHYAGGTGGAWVNIHGQVTSPRPRGWSNGAPFWRNGGDRNKIGDVTFRRSDGTWSNGPSAKNLPYHDKFGLNVGTDVTPWLSIATDVRVIPRGTWVYVPALAGSPAHGCFRADDTGGAIIGKHIDVFIPQQNTFTGLPEASEVRTLAPGDACPPATGPRVFRGLAVTYVPEARERDFKALRTTIPGMRLRARADFLFGAKGAAMRGGGLLPGLRRIVLVDHGGWWVNARGKRTDRRANGAWTNGKPVWRDGGWRNRRGRPTAPRANGRWSNGRGVRFLRYHDRFRLARDGERVPWQAVSAPAAVARLGARIAVTGLVSAGCLTVDRTLRHTAGSIEVLVPHGAALAGLPARADVTVLPANTPCVE